MEFFGRELPVQDHIFSASIRRDLTSEEGVKKVKILEFAVSLIPLIYLLFKEYLSAEAKAKEQDIQFKLTQDILRSITDAAFQKWIDRAAKDSQDMSDSWDAADQDFEKKDVNR
jgi:hypothetical protein